MAVADAAPSTTRRRQTTPAALTKAQSDRALAQFPFHFEVVEIARMFVDHDYQRPLTSFVTKVEENLNPALIMTLCVSLRTSGKYAVIDGQTRMVACERLGLTALPCLVYTGLSKADEARIFELLQTERRNITSWTRFRAALVAKNPEALAINALVESVGLKIGDPGGIKSVAALEKGYREDSFILERTLVALKEAWPDRTPSGQFIRAVHYFFRKLAPNMDVDDQRLVTRLRTAGTDQLAIRAAHLRAGGSRVSGSGATVYLAQAILNAYRGG